MKNYEKQFYRSIMHSCSWSQHLAIQYHNVFYTVCCKCSLLWSRHVHCHHSCGDETRRIRPVVPANNQVSSVKVCSIQYAHQFHRPSVQACSDVINFARTDSTSDHHCTLHAVIRNLLKTLKGTATLNLTRITEPVTCARICL